jgi:hypothetical protein
MLSCRASNSHVNNCGIAFVEWSNRWHIVSGRWRLVRLPPVNGESEMRSYGGFGQPGTILQCVFCRQSMLTAPGKQTRHALAISLVAATLITLAIGSNGWKASVAQDKRSSRVTVIYKNQLYPSIGELKARAAKTDEANSDKEVLFRRRGQWI